VCRVIASRWASIKVAGGAAQRARRARRSARAVDSSPPPPALRSLLLAAAGERVDSRFTTCAAGEAALDADGADARRSRLGAHRRARSFAMSLSRGESIIIGIVVAASLLLAGGAATVIVQMKKRPTRGSINTYAEVHPGSINGAAYELGQAPHFVLEDAAGGVFESKALAGKIWVVAFIFTRCGGTCPQMSEVMSVIQDKLSDLPDFAMLSISVDPENDTPQALNEYAKLHGADRTRWHFLRGTPEQIKKIEYDGFKLGNPEVLIEHSPKLVLVDQKGKIRGYFDGAGPERSGDRAELMRMARSLSGGGAN
jgi:cytochrome oxidase Cu insertion factor (SCO1/SenC/PrrC family)